MKTEINHHPTLLSVSQVAEVTMLTPQGIRKAISEGRINACRIGHANFVHKKDVKKFIKRRRRI